MKGKGERRGVRQVENNRGEEVMMGGLQDLTGKEKDKEIKGSSENGGMKGGRRKKKW